MIRLFRKIRSQLLTEGKYSIYILYASGEIVLVMVGILLALQIDNWNHQAKTRKELTEIFEEIHEDLARDTTSISHILNERNLDIQAQRRVIEAIEEGLSFNDQIQSDLGRVMLQRSVPLVSTGFNLLKESKLSSMEDRGLRIALIEHYEQIVPEMEEEYQDDRFEFENVLLPYIRHNFSHWEFGVSGIPANWDSLREDPYFLTALKMNLNNVNSTLTSLQDGLQSAIQIIELLNQKLIEIL